MRFIAASLIFISTTLCAVSAFSAEEITHISVIQAHTGRETALERRLPVGITHPKIGDRVVLHAGKSGNYSVEVTESRRSKFGNSIVHGVTPSGGRSLFVITDSGAVTGNLHAYDGRVQITTDKEGKITAWRSGIDALALPIDQGAVISPDEFSSISDEIAGESSRRVARSSKSERPASGTVYPAYAVGPHQIDILMYYDTELPEAGGVIDYVIALTNDAFERSPIPITVSVIAYQEVSIVSTDDNRDLLSKIRNLETPFADAYTKASRVGSDLVILIRNDKGFRSDNCGVATAGFYSGNVRRDSNRAVVEWRPASGSGEYYCSDLAMAHEIGHLLGSRHNREAPDYGGVPYATSYSEGFLGQTSRTIMSSYGDVERVGSYSNPRVLCAGEACGVTVGANGGADNARAFLGTGPIVAGYRGTDFSFATVRPYKSEYSGCSGEGSGWEGTGLRNHSEYDVELVSAHYIRTDGSDYVYQYGSDNSVVTPNSYRTRGWCKEAGEVNPLGSEYVETFVRYRHPLTDEIVETGHLYWDDETASYSFAQIATSAGGTVIGHTEQSLRVGNSYTASFVPDSGYRLDRLATNCEGQKTGDSFRIDATVDDCRIEAFFERDTECNTFGDAGAYIQKIFIGYLGRPAAPAGLEYFADYLNSDMEQGKLILFDDLYYSAEAAELYRESSLTDQINQFYRFMFSRGALSGGLNYWIDQINEGFFTIPASAAYIADAASGEDMEVLDAKQRAASKLTCAIGNDATKLSGFQSNLAAVWKSLSSITTAEEASAYDGEAELDRIINGG